ncbi:MAG: hypothetical protein FJ087_20635 [Deltaproteobacteria bacterium]|nr:hypothetical protein [Deltaproteobacteria bacterium]
MSRILAIGFAAAFLFAACGSDDGGGNSGGNTGGTRDKLGNCQGTAGQECTGTDEYVDCVTKACDTQYKNCLGPDYLSGTFAGKCKEFMDCVVACKCDDTACQQACAMKMTANAECGTCMQTLGTCTQGAGCTQPTCTTPSGGSGGGNGGSCDGLKACCNSMPAQAKDACLLAAGMMDDSGCTMTLEQYEKAGVCK